MNDPKPLEVLAMLDALGQTNADEKAQLHEALARDPSLASTHAKFSEDAHLMAALYQTDARQKSDPQDQERIPDRVRDRLHKDRQQSLARRTPNNVIAFDASVNRDSRTLREQHNRKVDSAAAAAPRRRMTELVARAAIFILLGSIGAYWVLRPKTVPIASAALAPRGVTSMTQPLIVWDNQPGQKYDVWILPPDKSQTEAPVLFVAKNVESPLEFSKLQPTANAGGKKELEPGKDYRLLVCFATLGKLAGVTVPFHTNSEAEGDLRLPSHPDAIMLKARRLLDAGKPGDAIMILRSLPEPQRQSPEAAALEAAAQAKLPAPDGPPRG